MSKISKIQTDFSWGEISPRLLSRIDLDAYDKATKTMENAYTLFHGGATRRPGTTFIAELYNSDEKAKLIPFTYDRDNSFVLILNGGKFEFIKNDQFIETSPGVTYKLNCPYTESELDKVRYAQFGNMMWFVHPDHPPKQLQRLSDSSWLFTDIDFVYYALTDYAYENYAVYFKILGSDTKFVVGDKFTFTTDGLGNASLATADPSNTGNGDMVQTKATSLAVAETWTVTCLYADEERQEWSVIGSVTGEHIATWTDNDYPSSIAFYQQRLFLAGTYSRPQHTWASVAGDYKNLTIGGNDKDGISFTGAFSGFDEIIHFVPAKYLISLTYAGEYIIGGTAGGVTPSALAVQPQTYHGSSNVRPIKVGNEIVFVQRDGKKIRAISYSVEKDINIAPDITLFAEHISKQGITDMTFAQDPDYIAWAIRSDGQLLSLTLNRDYDNSTVAWARHTTDGSFEAVSSIPTSSSQGVYVVVNRQINGEQKRYLEKIDYDSVCHSDCAVIQSDETAKTVWTGFDHIENKTVDVIADGIIHPSVLVESGSITLSRPVNEVKAGLHYETTIELLNPELGDANNTSQGRKIAVSDIILRLQDTLNCQVHGHGTPYPEDIPFRLSTDIADDPIPLFTGEKTVKAIGWSDSSTITIKQTTPLPFTLLGVVLKVQAGS